MILIDTDHATHPKYPESEPGRRLIERLNAVPPSEFIGVAIITVEERMRGWLAVIAKERTALRHVAGYRELTRLFEFYQEFVIVPFDEVTARRFDDLRTQCPRVGTMDLKITATALERFALGLHSRGGPLIPALSPRSEGDRLFSPCRPSRSAEATTIPFSPSVRRCP